MQRIYLDNAATTYPKAPEVGAAMKYYIESIGSSIKRGVYRSAVSAEEIVFETRELLCELFNFPRPENIIFTMNITHSLNYLLKGLLKAGDHCIVSSMEHNAVMRPLSQLACHGVSFSRVLCDEAGRLEPKDVIQHIKPNTKAVVMTHASNVCGTVLPLEQVGEICKKNNLLFIIDSAQSAGVLDIDYHKLNADAIAFTGHKGLLGPQGIGGFAVSDRMAAELLPVICGGTGSDSEYEEQPDYMPDKFEAGTPNIPGIFGLHSSLLYLKNHGISSIREAELELTQRFLDNASCIDTARIVGLPETKDRTAVVSIDFPDMDNGEISYLLDRDYGIMTRCGLHCAPSAHKTLETFPQGTVRFSLSHFNTFEDIDYAVAAIDKITKTLK